MKPKPVIARLRAQQDIDEALTHWLSEAGELAALGFIEALEQATNHVSHHPGTGSPRHGHELNLPGLRAWPLTRHPYLMFYMEQRDHIDLWRVPHPRRDIPAWMQDPAA